MVDCKGMVKFHSMDVTIVGEDIQAGRKAPEFTRFTDDLRTGHGGC
jgi:peroxiredoxin